MKLSKQKILSAVILSMLGSTSMVAQAQEAPKAEPVVYKGTTFDKIKKTGKIYVSYRHNSIPLSYLVDGKPSGFAYELCTEIANKVGQAVGVPVTIEYVRSELNDSEPDLISGRTDMECSSTIDNADRRTRMDFSVPYFFSGIRMLKPLGAPYYTLDDMKGRKIALIEGNKFPIDVVKKISNEKRLDVELVLEKSYGDAMKAVEEGRADAYVLNDLLLYGQRFNSTNPNGFVVSGPLLSIEPLAVMMRKGDQQFKDFVNGEMSNLMKTGRFDELYNKWFLEPLAPHYIAIGIPQSQLLKDVVRMPLDVSGE